MSQVFTRDELAAAFETFEQTVAEAAETKNWDDWVRQYTPDVDYIEHAAGTMKGREEVLTWIRKTMTTFPGSHMTAFPSLWSVIDEPAGRIICELDNPMVDPGDGTIISATNISIVTYAGDGQWRRQEDIYNPLRFLQAAIKWCKKAQALGTLDDDAADGCRHTEVCNECAQTGHRRQRIPRFACHPPARRRGRRRAGDGARGANTRSIDDLDVTRFHGDVFDTATVREAMDGCDQVYYCVVDTRAWLQTRRRCSAPTSRDCATSWTSPKTPACNGSSSPAPTRRWVAGTATWRPRTDRSVTGGLSPYVQSRVQAEELVHALRRRAGFAGRRHVRLDDLRQRRLGPHPARRVHRRRGLRQAAVPDERHPAGSRRRRRAARAMIWPPNAGARRGYLISERMIPLKEVVRIAADEAGVPPPRRAISVPMLYVSARWAACGPPDRQRCRAEPGVGAHDAG